MDIEKPSFYDNNIEQIKEYAARFKDALERKSKNIDITDLNAELAEKIKGNGENEIEQSHEEENTQSLQNPGTAKFHPEDGDAAYPPLKDSFTQTVNVDSPVWSAHTGIAYDFTVERRIFYPYCELYTITDLTCPVWEHLEWIYNHELEFALEENRYNIEHYGDGISEATIIQCFRNHLCTGNELDIVKTYTKLFDLFYYRVETEPTRYEPDGHPYRPYDVPAEIDYDIHESYLDCNSFIPSHFSTPAATMREFDYLRVTIGEEQTPEHTRTSYKTLPNASVDGNKLIFQGRVYRSTLKSCWNVDHGKEQPYVRQNGIDYQVFKRFNMLIEEFSNNDPYIYTENGNTVVEMWTPFSISGEVEFWYYDKLDRDFGPPLIPITPQEYEDYKDYDEDISDFFMDRHITFASTKGIADFYYFPFAELDPDTGTLSKAPATLEPFSFIKIGFTGRPSSQSAADYFYWTFYNSKKSLVIPFLNMFYCPGVRYNESIHYWYDNEMRAASKPTPSSVIGPIITAWAIANGHASRTGNFKKSYYTDSVQQALRDYLYEETGLTVSYMANAYYLYAITEQHLDEDANDIVRIAAMIADKNPDIPL